MKRQRGRNRNNRNNNNNTNPNRSMDSNGPGVKVRGNVNTIYEKLVLPAEKTMKVKMVRSVRAVAIITATVDLVKRRYLKRHQRVEHSKLSRLKLLPRRRIMIRRTLQQKISQSAAARPRPVKKKRPKR